MAASASVIREANAVVLRNAPQLNAAQRQLALAIGDFETGFGVSGSWLMPDGTPSYNWGGLVGSGTKGSISHGDINPDGTPHPGVSFKAFNNMDDAFNSFYRTWSKSDTLQAAAAGNATLTAKAMYGHGYFGGVSGTAEDRIRAYGKGIYGVSKTIASVIGESSATILGEILDSPTASIGSISGAGKIGLILAASTIAGIAYYLYSGRRY